jgi:hypothetical protein
MIYKNDQFNLHFSSFFIIFHAKLFSQQHLFLINHVQYNISEPFKNFMVFLILEEVDYLVYDS